MMPRYNIWLHLFSFTTGAIFIGALCYYFIKGEMFLPALSLGHCANFTDREILVSIRNNSISVVKEPVSRSVKFGSPFLVLTEGGCSGTSAILGRMLRQIVQTHGYKMSTTIEMLHVGVGNDSYDPLKIKKKNKYYFEILEEKNMTHKSLTAHKRLEILVESIKRAQKVAIASESLIVFKVSYTDFQVMHTYLDSLEGGVSYIGLFRENFLDRCTCMLKDCFFESKEFGHSVFGNGTESKLCFQRRKHPEGCCAGIFHQCPAVSGRVRRACTICTKSRLRLFFLGVTNFV